jgi:hypothetical protein
MKVVNKPIVREAFQWFKNGDHPEDACRLVTPVPGDGEPYLSEGKVVRRFLHPAIPGEMPCHRCTRLLGDHGWIDTLEGGHQVCPGDWIITGIAGEKYPCKPDIFERTYEPFKGQA